jgi:hypothetical protein
MGLMVILCDYGFEDIVKDIDGYIYIYIYIYINAKNLCYLESVITYG